MKVFLRNTEECEVYIAKVEKALRKASIDVVKKEDVTDGQLFIRHGNNWYNAAGIRVK